MGVFGSAADRRAQEARADFLASPVGRARASFERGDLVLQLELDPADQRPAVIPTHNAPTVRTSSDPTEILNAVCREGWELVTASMVPVETGGRRVGPPRAAAYYLFRRAPQHRGVAPAGS